MKRLFVLGLLAVSVLTACGKNDADSSTADKTPVSPQEESSIGLGNRRDSEVTARNNRRDSNDVVDTDPTPKKEKTVDSDALFDWNGVWETDYGEMRLTQAPPETVEDGEAPPVTVTGTYDTDEGKIDGYLYDGSLFGVWAETSSARKCDTSKLGSEYWGGIAYQKVDADTFKGVWTYCQELGPGVPTEGASSWDGKRISKVASEPENPQKGDEATSVGFRGTWDTSEGEMELAWADHVTVTGTYNQDGGKIIGNVEGNLKELNGYWIEDGSSQRCETERQGSYHWGRVQFVLNQDESEFDGQWSYCDAEPDSSWTGKRTS